MASVMTAAASQKLPIVFAHYAEAASQVSEPTAKGKAKNPEALFHGLPAIAVDASDAVAVYRVAYEAIIRARQGRGATLLQCVWHPARRNLPAQTSVANPQFTRFLPTSFLHGNLPRRTKASNQRNTAVRSSQPSTATSNWLPDFSISSPMNITETASYLSSGQ